MNLFGNTSLQLNSFNPPIIIRENTEMIEIIEKYAQDFGFESMVYLYLGNDIGLSSLTNNTKNILDWNTDGILKNYLYYFNGAQWMRTQVSDFDYENPDLLTATIGDNLILNKDTDSSNKLIIGEYNKEDKDVIFAIGNGTGENSRNNAAEINKNGDAKFTGEVFSKNKKLATEEFVTGYSITYKEFMEDNAFDLLQLYGNCSSSQYSNVIFTWNRDNKTFILTTSNNEPASITSVKTIYSSSSWPSWLDHGKTYHATANNEYHGSPPTGVSDFKYVYLRISFDVPGLTDPVRIYFYQEDKDFTVPDNATSVTIELLVTKGATLGGTILKYAIFSTQSNAELEERTTELEFNADCAAKKIGVSHAALNAVSEPQQWNGNDEFGPLQWEDGGFSDGKNFFSDPDKQNPIPNGQEIDDPTFVRTGMIPYTHTLKVTYPSTMRVGALYETYVQLPKNAAGVGTGDIPPYLAHAHLQTPISDLVISNKITAEKTIHPAYLRLYAKWADNRPITIEDAARYIMLHESANQLDAVVDKEIGAHPNNMIMYGGRYWCDANVEYTREQRFSITNTIKKNRMDNYKIYHPEPVEPEEPKEPEEPEEPIKPIKPDYKLYFKAHTVWDAALTKWKDALTTWETNYEKWETNYEKWETAHAQWEAERETAHAKWVTDHAKWVTDHAKWVTQHARWETAYNAANVVTNEEKAIFKQMVLCSNGDLEIPYWSTRILIHNPDRCNVQIHSHNAGNWQATLVGSTAEWIEKTISTREKKVMFVINRSDTYEALPLEGCRVKLYYEATVGRYSIAPYDAGLFRGSMAAYHPDVVTQGDMWYLNIRNLPRNQVSPYNKIPAGYQLNSIPYSSRISNGGDIGFNRSFGTFCSAVMNPHSKLYTEEGGKYKGDGALGGAASYYGSVCSTLAQMMLNFDIYYGSQAINRLCKHRKVPITNFRQVKPGMMMSNDGHEIMIVDAYHDASGAELLDIYEASKPFMCASTITSEKFFQMLDSNYDNGNPYGVYDFISGWLKEGTFPSATQIVDKKVVVYDKNDFIKLEYGTQLYYDDMPVRIKIPNRIKTPKKTLKKILEEILEEMREEMPEEMPEEILEETLEEMSEETLEEALKEVSEEMLEKKLEEKLKKILEEMLKETPDETIIQVDIVTGVKLVHVYSGDTIDDTIYITVDANEFNERYTDELNNKCAIVDITAATAKSGRWWMYLIGCDTESTTGESTTGESTTGESYRLLQEIPTEFYRQMHISEYTPKRLETAAYATDVIGEYGNDTWYRKGEDENIKLYIKSTGMDTAGNPTPNKLYQRVNKGTWNEITLGDQITTDRVYTIHTIEKDPDTGEDSMVTGLYEFTTSASKAGTTAKIRLLPEPAFTVDNIDDDTGETKVTCKFNESIPKEVAQITPVYATVHYVTVAQNEYDFHDENDENCHVLKYIHSLMTEYTVSKSYAFYEQPDKESNEWSVIFSLPTEAAKQITAAPFDENKIYKKNDMVTYNNKIWRAKKEIAAGNQPSSDSDWEEIVKTIATGLNAPLSTLEPPRPLTVILRTYCDTGFGLTHFDLGFWYDAVNNKWNRK